MNNVVKLYEEIKELTLSILKNLDEIGVGSITFKPGEFILPLYDAGTNAMDNHIMIKRISYYEYLDFRDIKIDWYTTGNNIESIFFSEHDGHYIKEADIVNIFFNLAKKIESL